MSKGHADLLRCLRALRVHTIMWMGADPVEIAAIDAAIEVLAAQ